MDLRSRPRRCMRTHTTRERRAGGPRNPQHAGREKDEARRRIGGPPRRRGLRRPGGRARRDAVIGVEVRPRGAREGPEPDDRLLGPAQRRGRVGLALRFQQRADDRVVPAGGDQARPRGHGGLRRLLRPGERRPLGDEDDARRRRLAVRLPAGAVGRAPGREQVANYPLRLVQRRNSEFCGRGDGVDATFSTHRSACSSSSTSPSRRTT